LIIRSFRPSQIFGLALGAAFLGLRRVRKIVSLRFLSTSTGCAMKFQLKKRRVLSAGLLLFAIACFGQVKSAAYRVMLNGLLKHSVPEISVQQVVQDRSDLVFVDAREPREYAVSHIQNAVFSGYDHFDPNLLSQIPKNQRIVVYCSVGYRSEKIVEKLRDAGYSNVSNLYGGIFEWVNQGHPVQNAAGPTNEVHAFDRTWGIWLHKGKKVYR
jgi:rhodanese-related sulfurtransferase